MAIIETLLAGGATGLLGGVFNKVFGLGEALIQKSMRKEDRAHELKLLEQQMKLSQQETENELAISQQKFDAAALRASYMHDTSSGNGSMWVVNLLRLIRPVLTLGLVVLTGFIYFNLSPEDYTPKALVINAIVYATVTAVLWWFGSRPHKMMKI